MKQLVFKFDEILTSENQIEIASQDLKIPGPQRTQGVHLHTTFILSRKVRLETNDTKFFFSIFLQWESTLIYPQTTIQKYGSQ